MASLPSPAARLILALAVLWHALAVLSPGWVSTAEKANNGRDFASYYYAVQAASMGADPYDKRMLAKAARKQGQRRSVHPFFYPPPFLLAMAWALPMDLHSAFQVWFWLDELAALAAMLALWGWWRELGASDVAVLVAVALAAMTAVPNNRNPELCSPTRRRQRVGAPSAAAKKRSSASTTAAGRSSWG